MAILVKFNREWAGEFELQGFYARKNSTIEEEQKRLLDTYNEQKEYWDQDEFDERDYEFLQISDSEFDVLHSLFGNHAEDFVSLGAGLW